MDWIVAPEQDEGCLPDVLPSLLAAMGVPGYTDVLGFPACRSAAVLLVDGLGWSLLREHEWDAPFLTSLATRTPIKAGFPTTTATSVMSLGTGRHSGAHGIVGYSFADQDGGLMYPLSWTRRDTEGRRHNVLKQWPPEEFQPLPTVLEQATDAGTRAYAVASPEFRDTGLTRAALRGGQFRDAHALGDLAAGLVSAVTEPALCYAYHGHLDLLGHLHGPGSPPWRFQLRQVDRFVAMLADALPPSAVLVVLADHGMVRVDASVDDGVLDADSDPALRAGVRVIGGEVRARHLYTEPGARDDVLAVWRERIEDRGLVVTGEEAIERGWFGPVVADRVRGRIGDVVVISREGGVIRSRAESSESALIGQHGSLTAAEQYIPLLVVGGEGADR